MVLLQRLITRRLRGVYGGQSRSPLAARRNRRAAQSRAERPGATAVGCPARYGRAGPAHGRHGERVVGELWTLERIAVVIERLTGIRHHPAHVWALLRHRLGWPVQRPKRRAAERDQAAIDQWIKKDWPPIKQAPNGAEPAWSSSTKAPSA